jgi:voltage-gated potassium channel Kch
MGASGEGLGRNDGSRPRDERVKTNPFVLLFAALLTMFGVQALGLSGTLRSVVLAPIGLLVIAAMLWVLKEQRVVFWTTAVLAIPAAINTVLTPGPVEAADITESGFHWPFFCFAAAAVTARVVRSERADVATVIGSICAYLLIAFAFTSLYVGLELASPGSFRFGDQPPDYLLFSALSYFSLVTLTTLGYGDTVPLSEIARAFVTLESVIGILFPSFVIARIVSLTTSGGGRPFAARPEGVRRPGRFEGLLAVEIAFLLLIPFLESSPTTRIGLRLLSTALLLAALYAGSSRPVTRALGISLASVSLIGSWWTSGPDWLPVAAFGAQVVFLGLVCGSMLLWLVGERRVTRDLLVAAASLYMLLGFAWSTLYRLIEWYTPGSIGTPDGSAMETGDSIYFSFMTLTTTGYGDFLPLSQSMEQIATLEALVGILFPTVLVARLVALYRSE